MSDTVQVLADDNPLAVDASRYHLIDDKTRALTQPEDENEKILGVETDKDAVRRYFKCPKIVGDNIDLTQCQLYVGYIGAKDEKGKLFLDEEPGRYHCDDVAEDGDYILFSWKLSGNVFLRDGYVAYNIYAVSNNGDETEMVWNTTPAIGRVLRTVPKGIDIVERFPDVINQLFERLLALEAKIGTSGGGTSFSGSAADVTYDDTETELGADNVQDAIDKLSEEKADQKELENYALKNEIPTVPVQSVNGKTGAVQLSASDVGADANGTAQTKVSEHNTSESSHNDIRLLISGLTSRLNALANSDDTTLDQMAEVVAYIKNNKSLIDGITTSKVNVSDIIDNLTTSVSNKPLSAKQGVKLKALIDAIVVPTKTSQLTNDSGFLTEVPNEVLVCTESELEALTQEELTEKYADGTRIVVVVDGYTNLVEMATNKLGAIYNGCGYMNNYRLNSSGNVVASDYDCETGFMPYVHGETIVASGSKVDGLTNSGHYVAVYDKDYNVIQSLYSSALVSNYGATWDVNSKGFYELTIDTSKISAWSNAKYFRVSFSRCVGANMVVTSKGV